MILAGDIGGTKVDLGLFQVTDGRLELEHTRRYATRDFSGLEPVLEAFLKETGARPRCLSLGAAGPVIDGRCRLTHLSWHLVADSLQSRFGVTAVLLVNDLAAMAASVPYIKPEELAVLQPGQPASGGRVAVLAPGTGLGQAFLLPAAGVFRVMDTEGGQVDFAARDAEETDLLHFLKPHLGRVRVEDVVSGPGLVRLYGFYRQRLGSAEPEDLESAFPEESAAGVVCRRGLEEADGPYRAALDRFVSVCGAVAGNLALQMLARGGVYLGGGIAPKILDRLQQGLFIDAFRDKGSFRDMLERIPVRVILNDRAALWGAAGLLLGDRVALPETG